MPPSVVAVGLPRRCAATGLGGRLREVEGRLKEGDVSPGATRRLSVLPPRLFCQFHSEMVFFDISLGQVVLFDKISHY
jgi:hypothetical protein